MTYNVPLSYSSIALYKECPRLWASVYKSFRNEEKGARPIFSNSREQRQWEGSQDHKMLEDFFLGGTCYPYGVTRLVPWRDVFLELRGYGVLPEWKVAVDSNWNPCNYYDKQAMLIAKVDLTLAGEQTLHTFDLKTGGIYATHEFQGQVYTAMARGRERYRFTSVYLDLPCYTRTWEYSTDEHAEIRVQLQHIIGVIRADDRNDPTPGKACDSCPLNHNKGGTCHEGL
jgi:hypothetical protein